LTSFVGRERELAAVRERLRAARLVTLTGAGGAGKTRLAIEVARLLADAYRDGVWLVELAALADPSALPQFLASELGPREASERRAGAALINPRRPRHQLLILDNCEHLIAAAAALVATLVRSCPDLTILATSREPLGVNGEVT